MSVRVKFVYRNYRKLHTIHSSIIENPPKGVSFIVPEEKTYLKPLYKVFSLFKGSRVLPKIITATKDKIFAKNLREEGIDLLHFINFIPQELDSALPYVVDLEHVVALTDFIQNDEFLEKKVVPFLENDECKKIIPLTNAAKKTLEKKLGHNYLKIKKKIKIVYPSLPLYEDKNLSEDKNSKMTFLFVGKGVYRKGLPELLEAFSRLPKEEAILKIVSVVPVELKEKYSQDNIQFFPPQYTHQEILQEFFSKADMFVMPTHIDTFGMVFLDAMSCGTPVIATNQFAIPEIVEDNKTGFLVETKKQYLWNEDFVSNPEIKKELMVPEEALIDGVYEKLVYCIKNPGLLREMSSNTRELFKGPSGKFSVERRNRLLKKIYKEAIG